MTYFLVFNFIPLGLSRTAVVYKLTNDGVEYVTQPSKFFDNNPYGDIYFISVHLENLKGNNSYVELTFQPLWIFRLLQLHIYAFKLLYFKSYNNILLNYTPENIRQTIKKCINTTFKEYESKFGVIEPKHYIIGVDTTQYASHVFVCVYIVKPINKRDAIKIIREYEPLVLWEIV